ncbi:MAG TPA: MFS transporter [Bacteroidales bacterium]|nr:MFS transporter [Bacteroidales bacterium]
MNIKIKNFRWWIAILLAAATALNYLDRQSLPVVIKEIQKTIPISDIDYAYLQMAFLLAYGIMYAVGGKIFDLLGTRIGYAIMIIWWSLANMLQGLVSSVSGLGVARFFLGVGEGGGFPGSAKAVSEWFPPKERSFAFGIFNTGSSLGAVVAPPLIALIAVSLSWRWVFIIFGLAGLIWVFIWYFIYNVPAKSKFVTNKEKEYIGETIALNKTNNEIIHESSIRWIDLFKYRKLWGLLLIKLFSDSAWYFFIFWLPKYLGDIRHLDIKEIGYYAWIPYAFAGVGSFVGGWLSSFLISRNLTLDASRKIALGIAAALLPVSLLITNAPLGFAIVFFSIAMLGHQFWSTIVQTLAADIFPSSVVGSVAGLMGAIGSFGALLFNLLVGILVTNYGYSPVFIIAGMMHPLSFVLVLLIIRKIELVKLKI